MAGDKADIQTPEQLEMWTWLGSNRAVAGAAGRAAGPARPADAKTRDRGSADALDLGQVAPPGKKAGMATPRRETGAAKGKVRIVPAKHGNAFVVVRRE